MENVLMQEQCQHEATSLNKKMRIRRELNGMNSRSFETLEGRRERRKRCGERLEGPGWPLMVGDRGVVGKPIAVAFCSEKTRDLGAWPD